MNQNRKYNNLFYNFKLFEDLFIQPQTTTKPLAPSKGGHANITDPH